MKVKNKSLALMLPALFVLAMSMPANAQDDLYYDPSTDTKTVTTYEEDYDEQNNVTRRYDEDDENYYEEDDYAYEYSSRIRRFHRPAQVIDYYDPFFVDLWYYDPFYLPGASIYTYGYNDYWTWRRWQRWQRWNSFNTFNIGWGYGWNTWSWGINYGWGGYNPWNNPCVWNNYYYDPYWTWNGYNPYYGNAWVNNNYYYNNQGGYGGGYSPQTYTGPRRHGTTVKSGYARLANGDKPNGRLVVATDPDVKVIDLRSTRPSNRVTPSDKAQIPSSRINETRKPSSTTTKDPVRANPQVEKTRPETGARPSREAKPNEDATPNERPSTRPTEQPRTEEPRPSRRPSTQPETTRPSRNPSTQPETRPSRSGGSEARPSRPSSEDRPSRPSGGETRPSRSNDSGGSKWNSGSSERGSSSSGSSGRSSSGSSNSGSSKSSSGGSRGRN